jgi:hypothetical protein
VIHCTNCGSDHARVIVYHGTDHPDYVRVWKGRRFLTCRCADCGQEFYIEEPRMGNNDPIFSNDQMVDDEEALQAAEDDLKRQIWDENDRQCR